MPKLPTKKPKLRKSIRPRTKPAVGFERHGFLTLMTTRVREVFVSMGNSKAKNRIQQLLNHGFNAKMAKAAWLTIKELRDFGFSDKELLRLGFTPKEISVK